MNEIADGPELRRRIKQVIVERLKLEMDPEEIGRASGRERVYDDV